MWLRQESSVQNGLNNEDNPKIEMIFSDLKRVQTITVPKIISIKIQLSSTPSASVPISIKIESALKR